MTVSCSKSLDAVGSIIWMECIKTLLHLSQNKDRQHRTHTFCSSVEWHTRNLDWQLQQAPDAFLL